jgi:hypothetical protein
MMLAIKLLNNIEIFLFNKVYSILFFKIVYKTHKYRFEYNYGVIIKIEILNILRRYNLLINF